MTLMKQLIGYADSLGGEDADLINMAINRIEELERALTVIARQKLATEMDERDTADFEGAYQYIIEHARAALAEKGGNP